MAQRRSAGTVEDECRAGPPWNLIEDAGGFEERDSALLPVLRGSVGSVGAASLTNPDEVAVDVVVPEGLNLARAQTGPDRRELAVGAAEV
jgi:hypothetical protein